MSTLLNVAGLNAWYGESHVLHGVNMQVNEGETVCILGRNGMGKTTTLRAIMGIVKKRTGRATFAGQDLLAMPLHRVARAGLGFVPEERGIFATLSVEENLMLPPKVAEGGMSVAEIYDLFPNLQERRNSPGTKLSGGEQQMLAIGRALMLNPSVLLLDEPTEGLAPIIVQELLAGIRHIIRDDGMATIIVEQHARKILGVTDRAVILDRGRVVHEGASAALLSDPAALETHLGVIAKQGATHAS